MGTHQKEIRAVGFGRVRSDVLLVEFFDELLDKSAQFSVDLECRNRAV